MSQEIFIYRDYYGPGLKDWEWVAVHYECAAACPVNGNTGMRLIETLDDPIENTLLCDPCVLCSVPVNEAPE